jgi:sigma-B regulation protein RsbU (phosphoserine phosphatase)
MQMLESQPIISPTTPPVAEQQQQLLERRRRLDAALAHGGSVQLANLLEEVDTALARIEQGSYGKCTHCDATIEAERLAADPLTQVCLQCLSPAEQQALEHDLSLASSIQTALLPEGDLAYQGWELHYEYRPHGTVGGDYCDLISMKDDGLLFVLGDVSGKGVSAAILVSHLHATFRALVDLDLSLPELVARANHLLCIGTTASSFATLVCGRLEPTGRVEACNAGHCPPLLAGSGSIDVIPATGLPLGMFCSTSFTTQSFQLQRDDRLFLYTDGLSERRNHKDEEYGIEDVRAQLASHRNASARDTIREAIERLTRFGGETPATDDLTLMVVRRIA